MQLSNRLKRLEKLIPPPPEKPQWEIEWERQNACDHPSGSLNIFAVAIEGRPGDWTFARCSKCGYAAQLLDVTNLRPEHWDEPGRVGGDWDLLIQQGYLDYVPFSLEIKKYYEKSGAFKVGKPNEYYESAQEIRA